MLINSVSLSYIFMGIGVGSLIAFAYFKLIVTNSSERNDINNKITGNMKRPKTWRKRNNNLAYTTLFWAIASIGSFIYLKYYINPTLVSIWYLIVYIVILVSSFSFFSFRNEREKAV